jgi:hypothetical protein
MRLLHVTQLRFEEFFSNAIPPYAILSHRWGTDDVSYQDFLAGRKRDGAGYAKIAACCTHVANNVLSMDCPPSDPYYLDWVWIEDQLLRVGTDTYCVDKTSSAELSEAINSMFRWCEKVSFCYVYLKDVIKRILGPTRYLNSKEANVHSRMDIARAARSSQRTVLGQGLDRDKGNNRLSWVISYVTGIEDVDLTYNPSYPLTVATKMRWAANRETSREEDHANYLLGLLGINLPLLYGERYSAFERLQQEIIRTSDDESVFLWRLTGEVESEILAAFPYEFSSRAGDTNQPMSTLSLETFLVPLTRLRTKDSRLMYPQSLPNCRRLYHRSIVVITRRKTKFVLMQLY